MSIWESTKSVLDFISFTATVAVLCKLLPALAALASLIWTCISIYEKDTVQKYLDKRRAKALK